MIYDDVVVQYFLQVVPSNLTRSHFPGAGKNHTLQFENKYSYRLGSLRNSNDDDG